MFRISLFKPYKPADKIYNSTAITRLNKVLKDYNSAVLQVLAKTESFKYK